MGYQSCPKCKGLKKVDCTCIKYGKADKLCSYCDGTGKVRCQSCDGKGTVYIGNKP